MMELFHIIDVVLSFAYRVMDSLDFGLSPALLA